MNSDRLTRVLAAIDAVNRNDPVKVDVAGTPIARAEFYGQRMSAQLEAFCPDAPEALRIAARAQHIERWVSPRESYDAGRIGYLRWRKELQAHHAKRAGELMAAQGYGAEEIERVAALLRKERLKHDTDAQCLEDVICLVFLQFEAPDFIAKHDDAKVLDILAKTARKMSPLGLAEIGKLKLDQRLTRLISSL